MEKHSRKRLGSLKKKKRKHILKNMLTEEDRKEMANEAIQIG